VTLIIEFCLLSHLIGALKLQAVISSHGPSAALTDQDLLSRFATQSMSRLFSVSFLVSLMFLGNPFIAYLVFKNKGALEVTFTHLLQIYGYSLAVFVPLGFLHCLLYPLGRLRLVLTVAAVCISLYYIFKETREFVVKYLEGQDQETFKYMQYYTVASTTVFALLFRYYFLAA
jgi:hypothetical protein